MPMAKITPMGESGLYHIHFLDRTDPGFGQGGGEHPGNRPPGSGGGHPDQGLPGHGHPSHPIHPGQPAIPGNELPDSPPPTLLPGYTLVMVRGPHGRWEYAFIDPGSPPPKPLPPGSIEHPGNRPPGSGGPVRPDQGLPGNQPHPGGGPMPGNPVRPDQGLPATPQPKS